MKLFSRLLLALCGLFILAYSFTVLLYVQLLPDLGLRTAFSTNLRVRPIHFDSRNEFHQQDQVLRVGPIDIPAHPWAWIYEEKTKKDRGRILLHAVRESPAYRRQRQ